MYEQRVAVPARYSTVRYGSTVRYNTARHGIVRPESGEPGSRLSTPSLTHPTNTKIINRQIIITESTTTIKYKPQHTATMTRTRSTRTILNFI